MNVEAVLLLQQSPVDQRFQLILVVIFVLAAVVDLVARMRRDQSQPGAESDVQRTPLGDEMSEWEPGDRHADSAPRRRGDVPDERSPVARQPGESVQMERGVRGAEPTTPSRNPGSAPRATRPSDTRSKNSHARSGARHARAEPLASAPITRLDARQIRAGLDTPNAIRRTIVMMAVLGPCRANDEHRV